MVRGQTIVPVFTTIPTLGLLLLTCMVVATSQPETSYRHKRSYNSGGNGENRVGSNSGTQSVTNLFSTANGTVIVSQIGGTATLPCNIKKHNTAVVTWIRKKDHHLLTVGGSTYSHDSRFSVRHARHLPASWPLVLRKVVAQDQGLYECQLSVHPPVSIYIHLKVVEAYGDIEGAPDVHVRSGSELRLVCRLRLATETPSYVFWYHGEKMINYETSRGVVVVTGGNFGSNGGYSELKLPLATTADAGNYTCVPSHVKPASVLVHVHDDAACPPNGQSPKPGQDPGLIVQCPLATKDRQDAKQTTVTVTDSSEAYKVKSLGYVLLTLISYMLINS